MFIKMANAMMSGMETMVIVKNTMVSVGFVPLTNRNTGMWSAKNKSGDELFMPNKESATFSSLFMLYSIGLTR
jgi:hypothetical protein